MTALALRYEGLRRDDVSQLAHQLKVALAREPGAVEHRPSATMFDAWLLEAGSQVTASSDAEATMMPGSSLPQPRRLGGARTRSIGVLPLQHVQPQDPVQSAQLHTLLRRSRSAAWYFLDSVVFPTVLRYQAVKLSSSGSDLGGDILFGTPHCVCGKSWLSRSCSLAS